LLDPDDDCPTDPEDADGFEDWDGCPDLDDDRDGIPDADDACPREAEDVDGVADEDGCPDPDADGDGILDVDDACPHEPEVVNGVEDTDGCPDEGLIEFVDDRIILDSRVLFDTNGTRLRDRSRQTLDAIAVLWRQHPEWAAVRIEGHADFRGPDAYNQLLSDRRAERVVEALVRRGMPAEMLTAAGLGSSRPRSRGDSRRSLQANRRVEFVVTRRRPVDEAALEEVGTR
jgi:outer membrane protein OmpA-like peptidoglycan-associated protein